MNTLIEPQLLSSSDIEVIELVLTDLRPTITTLVTSKLDASTSSSTINSLVDDILSQLRSVIADYVVVIRGDLAQQSQSSLARSIATRVSPTVRALARTVVSSSYGSGSSASVDAMAQEVFALLRPAILRQVESSVSANASWLSSQSAQDELVALVIAQLRSLVVSEVRAQVNAFTATTTTTTVVSSGGGAIRNIFGMGGANNVKVATPEYQYQYQSDRK